MDLRVVGPDFQRFLILRDAVVDAAPMGQRVAQVVVGLGVVRLDFQRLLIMCHRLIEAPLAGQGNAQVVVGLGVIRLDFQRLLIMCHRLIEAPLAGQIDAQIVMSDRVPRRACHGMGPERFAVAPIACLPPRTSRQDCQHQ